MNHFSPHLSRIFSAPLFSLTAKAALWLIFLGFIAINLYSRLTETPFWQKNLSVLTNPQSLLPHIVLAQSAWTSGDWRAAKNELLVAQSLNILGASTSPLDLLQQWEKEPTRLGDEVSFWQQVVVNKPDYRDGFIMLAAVHYQLNNNAKATQYLETAKLLDPNNPYVKKLSDLLATTR